MSALATEVFELLELPGDLLSWFLPAALGHLACDARARCAVLSRRFRALVASPHCWASVDVTREDGRALRESELRMVLAQAGPSLRELRLTHPCFLGAQLLRLGRHTARELVLHVLDAFLSAEQRLALEVLFQTGQHSFFQLLTSDAETVQPDRYVEEILARCPSLHVCAVEMVCGSLDYTQLAMLQSPLLQPPVVQPLARARGEHGWEELGLLLAALQRKRVRLCLRYCFCHEATDPPDVLHSISADAMGDVTLKLVVPKYSNRLNTLPLLPLPHPASVRELNLHAQLTMAQLLSLIQPLSALERLAFVIPAPMGNDMAEMEALCQHLGQLATFRELYINGAITGLHQRRDYRGFTSLKPVLGLLRSGGRSFRLLCLEALRLAPGVITSLVEVLLEPGTAPLSHLALRYNSILENQDFETDEQLPALALLLRHSRSLRTLDAQLYTPNPVCELEYEAEKMQPLLDALAETTSVDLLLLSHSTDDFSDRGEHYIDHAMHALSLLNPRAASVAWLANSGNSLRVT